MSLSLMTQLDLWYWHYYSCYYLLQEPLSPIWGQQTPALYILLYLALYRRYMLLQLLRSRFLRCVGAALGASF